MGYSGHFHILDVLEHELDRIHGCLTRNEDHWKMSSDQGTAIGEYNISFYAHHKACWSGNLLRD